LKGTVSYITKVSGLVVKCKYEKQQIIILLFVRHIQCNKLNSKSTR
jgi:hypothetical protein